MRRSDHPSRPSAITCCRFSALKTLAILAAGAEPTAQVNVSTPGPLAGFQVSINGRFWVSTEAEGPASTGFETPTRPPPPRFGPNAWVGRLTTRVPRRSRWTTSPNSRARSSGSERPDLVTAPRPAGVPLPVARKPHVLETRAARTTGYGDDWPLRARNCCLALRPHDLPRPV